MVEHVVRRIVQCLTAAVVVLMVVMITATSLQVFCRYVLDAPLSWSEEASRYCFVWIVFLGAALGLERGVHIGVDILVQRFAKPLRRGLAMVCNALIVVFCLVVGYVSFPVLELNMLQRSPALDLPMSYVYAAIPVSMILMVVLTVLRAVAHARQATTLSSGALT